LPFQGESDQVFFHEIWSLSTFSGFSDFVYVKLFQRETINVPEPDSEEGQTWIYLSNLSKECRVPEAVQFNDLRYVFGLQILVSWTLGVVGRAWNERRDWGDNAVIGQNNLSRSTVVWTLRSEEMFKMLRIRSISTKCDTSLWQSYSTTILHIPFTIP
jgi:hypothetical protein